MTTPNTDSTSTTEEQPQGQGPEGNGTTEEQKTGENAGQGTEGQGEGNTDSTDSEAELPEWVRKELTKVRGEAANYRTRLREAETRLEQAKTPEEFEAALQEVKEKNAELERSVQITNVARKFGLPDELAARLKGSTPEELEKDAKALQKFVLPATPESLNGGLDPSDDDDGEMDPRKLARKVRR